VSVKKATEKGKEKAKKSAKKSAKTRVRSPKKPADMARVRENINNLVRESAKDIATEVIKVAKTGQLASVRYLFEAVGLYPATEETAADPQVNSLAHTLLKRMGLPIDPVIVDEELPPGALTIVSGTKAAARVAAEDDPVSEGEKEREPDSEKGEE
jgi:hypothetical protein